MARALLAVHDDRGLHSSGTRLVVYGAIFANFAIALTKFVAAGITGSSPLKLYTLYSPPNHRDGVVHATRAAAEADTEEFDGKTSE